ncbi:MAG: methyltransferase domain-containing protein [Bacteroidales bacterium]|nr:methyltransferase domain-containing protein [Bacteroidales bacterium]
MYIAILGRQPVLGIAELEKVFGTNSVHKLTHQSVKFEAKDFDIEKFGGILKAGKIIFDSNTNDWRKLSQQIEDYYFKKWTSYEGKITLGLSLYDYKINIKDIQQIGLNLKRKLKKSGTNIRLVPNSEHSLSTATSHHNKLGLSQNKVELIIVNSNEGFVVAESTGSQNITAYANRDQARPKRDAFVGMLPPKLAQIMINLAHVSSPATILDPFCGTGVILQEALLMGYFVYGTDLSEKMVDYSRENLKWLSEKYRKSFDYKISDGDATKTKWDDPINAVVCESYLGQPFSAPPSPAKLAEVVKNCDHIVTEFLKNISTQIDTGTPLCIAVPAWRDNSGNFTHLPLISTIGRLGYKRHEFKNVSQNDLLYFRENQVVARELLVLTKS